MDELTWGTAVRTVARSYYGKVFLTELCNQYLITTTMDKYTYLCSKVPKAVAGAPWDPWIHPETGHIPECRTCAADYAAYMRTHKPTMKMTHTSACLWHDYFVAKAGVPAVGGRDVFTLLPPRTAVPTGDAPCYCCGAAAPLPQAAPVLCPSCFSKLYTWSTAATGKSNLRRGN